MRRIVIVCLLLLLPWQVSWAGLVGFGGHECGCVTMQEAGDPGPCAAPIGPDSPCVGDETAAGCDADCPNGHGQAQPGLLGVPPSTQACPGRWRAGDHGSPFRSHAPPQPLRPPQAKLA
jgi:hypothetical protein